MARDQKLSPLALFKDDVFSFSECVLAINELDIDSESEDPA
jgi:hypothetical protein